MLKDNQDNFLLLEGFELMMRFLQEQKYAAGCVFNAINYAITKHIQSCERFVDCGGLKYIFPVLMGKGLKKSLKKKGGSSGEKRNLEQVAISIISQLCTQLYHSSNPDYRARIAAKLVEQSFEKLLLCCELYDKYFKILEKTEADIEETRQRLMKEGDVEALTEFEDEDYIYIQVRVILNLPSDFLFSCYFSQ
jgi:beta-catenin-like protein 1